MLAKRSLLLILGVAMAGAPAAQARYELGLRVRAFETAFEGTCEDVAVRERVREPLQRAVTAFFAFRLGEVARNLDEARRALNPEKTEAPYVIWAESLSLRLRRRLVDATAPTVELRLQPCYGVEAEAPDAARLRLRLVDATGGALQESVEFELEELPLKAELPLPADVPGDHRLIVEVRAGDALLAQSVQTLSCVRDLEARFAAVASLAKAEPDSTMAATGRGLARLVQALYRGGNIEADVPADRHLAELEAIAAGNWPFGLDRPGDFRIWLHTPDGTVASRVMVPAQPAAKRLPVVVARHGAGGSENLFFDAYGAGKIVRLCRERGWLLIAPGAGLGSVPSVATIVDALAKLYPVDRERVFAVGHSMGASTLMREVAAGAEVFRAVALLGGGGSARPSEGLRELPMFLAPGEHDFARPNARRLRDALTAAGIETLAYREYEQTEHFGIVQIALADTFRFFDRFAGRRE